MRGGAVGVVLEPARRAGVKGLSQRAGMTLFQTVLAGWAIVLSRLAGQAEVVIGTPTANRGRAELEGVIGFFVNTLALRVDLGGEPTVEEVLGRVRAQALAAQAHEDLPFEQVVEVLQPVRSLAHHPVFQVMFAWHNLPGGRLELPGVEVAGLGAMAGVATAKFDLLLDLSEVGEEIVGGIEYATALFERATVERYAGYLRTVLAGMVADAGQAIGSLPLLGEVERRQVVEWNATAVAYPREQVHELFEAQVARTPDAVAVVYEDTQLTYAELNARANQVARYLQEVYGVGPGAGGAVSGAEPRARSRAPGGAQGRGVLRPAGSELSGGAAALHARGQRARPQC